MKRYTLLLASFMTFVASSFSQTSITEKVFTESVENKVVIMQKLIGFDDQTAQKIMHLELIFLLNVNKVEHSFWGRKQVRIEKLKKSREQQLEKLLSRDQFIKYTATENKLLNEKNRLWLE